MFCSACGKEISDGVAGCAGCGKLVNQPNADAIPQNPPIQAENLPPSANSAVATPRTAMSAKWISLGITIVALAIGVVWYMTKPVQATHGSPGLKNVIIPTNVTKIEDEAFDECTSLKRVTIPNGVTSIGDRTFCKCTGLESVTIPSSVTEIGVAAFGTCTSLKRVTIPNGVTSIGNCAFSKCTSLESVTISPNVIKMGKGVFMECSSLESVTIPSSVTEIGEAAFDTCTNLKNVVILNGVTSIGNSAFFKCTSLKSVTIPPSVTKIGNGVFMECSSLESVTIPSSVTEIGEVSFGECTSLKSVTIPPSVTKIGKFAFAGCSNLTSVAIPGSVTEIADTAFALCPNLKISVAADNPQYISVNGKLRKNNGALDDEDTRITIKGLYIGMDIKTVSAILTEKLSGTKWKPYVYVFQDKDGKNGTIISIGDASEQWWGNAEEWKRIFSGTKWELDEIVIQNIGGKDAKILTIKNAGSDDIKTISALLQEKKSETEYKPYETVITNKDGKDIKVITIRNINNDPGCIRTDSNANGKVGIIIMQKELMNDLFKAYDLDNDGLANLFAKKYNIPEMKLSFRGGETFREYTSPDGVKVVIAEKNLFMVKVPSVKERQQSFD